MTRPLFSSIAWLALVCVGCGSSESPGVVTDAAVADTSTADTHVAPDVKADVPLEAATDTKPTGLPEGADCTPGETDPCAPGLLCCVTCCGTPPPPDSGPISTTTCVKAPGGKCPPPPP